MKMILKKMLAKVFYLEIKKEVLTGQTISLDVRTWLVSEISASVGTTTINIYLTPFGKLSATIPTAVGYRIVGTFPISLTTDTAGNYTFR